MVMPQELLTLKTLGLITFNFLSTLNLSLKPLNPTHSPTKITHKDTNFFAYKAQYHPQFWSYLQHVTQGFFNFVPAHESLFVVLHKRR
nr:hypothetical protein CFP56_00062 [Quercus suber]